MLFRLLVGEVVVCECHKRTALLRYCPDGLCLNFGMAVDMGVGVYSCGYLTVAVPSGKFFH